MEMSASPKAGSALANPPLGVGQGKASSPCQRCAMHRMQLEFGAHSCEEVVQKLRSRVGDERAGKGLDYRSAFKSVFALLG